MTSEQFETIPEVADAGLKSWRDLPGGLSNRSILLETGFGPWVLRLNQENPGVDRLREQRALAIATRLGLAPDVIACRPDQGYLLTEFHTDPVWSREQLVEPHNLELLTRRLRELHQVPAGDEAVLDPRLVLDSYLSRSPLKESQRLRAGINGLLLDLETDGYFEHRVGWCHHDLNQSNILGFGDLRLLDWEFAAPGNPLLDLGFLAQYHDMTPEETWNLLVSYYGQASKHDLARITQVIRLAQLMTLLWLSARSVSGPLSEDAASRLRQLAVVWT